MRAHAPSRDHLKGILIRSPDNGGPVPPWALPFPDATTQLETMAELRDRGLLSKPEFENQKARILRPDE